MKKYFIIALIGLVGTAFNSNAQQKSNNVFANPAAPVVVATPPAAKPVATPVAYDDTAIPTITFYGAKNAPIRVDEYASLSCPHCGAFYQEAFAKIKPEYIIKGNVYWVLHHFPLNLQAFRAAQLVECQKTNSLKQAITRTLFTTQMAWAFSQKDEAGFMGALGGIAKLAGMNEVQFKQCIADKNIENGILESIKKAAKDGVKSTPSFYINGKYVEKATEYPEIKKALDAALNATAKR